MWCSGGDGRVHTSGSPQLCFLRAEKFQGSAFGWSADDESAIHLRPAIPPLFHRSYKVRPRKHGEETVAICGGCFITGAGRVALVCWPAVVDGLPKKKKNKIMTTGSQIDAIMTKDNGLFFFLYSQQQKRKCKGEKELFLWLRTTEISLPPSRKVQ